VLVVDDHATSRKKLSVAVRKLGFEVEAAEEGAAAIQLLRDRPVDAILLDIVMPVMDGFEVLAALKTDADLSDIPVIVVSAMEDDTASVVRAIELGAEDFLPKDFDPVILRARLSSSLEKKHNRDREREFRRHVDQLTSAAEELETGLFQPERLKIENVADRTDNLGRLARVFKGMAEEIYRRELKLRKNVRALRGSLLVLAVGASWGLLAPLSRMAASLDSQPLALAIWVNLIIAALCLASSAIRGKFHVPDLALLRFCLWWGILVGVLQQLALFWVTAHVQATTVSLIVTLEGFMVFAVAAALRLERATMKRMIGLAFGLVGSALVILSRESLASGDTWFWLLVAASVPFLFAVEDIFLASRRPDGTDIIHSTGIMAAISCVITLVVALLAGAPVRIEGITADLAAIVFLIAVASALGTVLSFSVATIAGAVFASQAAYAIAIAGIIWSMLLLDESMSPLAWGALAFMMLGLYFVEPQSSAEDYEFRLPFGDRARAGMRKSKGT
jgi:DNA-binding response OmpR family regulator/drug/metabolite transporter (DMT)-like permease